MPRELTNKDPQYGGPENRARGGLTVRRPRLAGILLAAAVLAAVLAGALFGTTNAQSQSDWSSQTSNVGVNLYDVHFADRNNGWAVGDTGTILLTTDGGANWNTRNSGTTRTLTSVVFADRNNGWTVGGSGTILRTTDGGTTWNTRNSNAMANLEGVHFVDGNNGWAVGSGGTIVRTADGGSTWSRQNSRTTQQLWDVHFADRNNGWAVGTGGTILSTTDGGANWRTQNSRSSAFLRNVHFINPQRGWVVGNGGTLLRTTDGGANWSRQNSGTTRTLTSVDFADRNNGWAVGASGTILRTTDGGTNWNTRNSGTTQHLWDVYFLNPERGWAVGSGGTIRTIFRQRPPPLLGLSPFYECCIYEERGRQMSLLKVDLGAAQPEDVRVSMSWSLGDAAADFESFQVEDVTIPAGWSWVVSQVTALPHDDEDEEQEKRLTVTATAIIDGWTHRDTQELKLIDNDAPAPSPDANTGAPPAVTAEGLVTWQRAEPPVPGQIYLLRRMSGETPPRSAADMDAPGYGNGWIADTDCGTEVCEIRIADFDPEHYYLIEVRSVHGFGEHSWQSVTYSPAGAGGSAAPGGATPAPTRPADPPAVSVRPTALTVDEAGGTAAYAVALDARPEGTATISVSSSDTSTATARPMSLTFTTDNWNTPQTVTVTGVDDDLDNEGDLRTVTISHAASGGGYDEVPVAPVAVTVRDDDSSVDPGITLSTNALEISEDGGGGSYWVNLASQPEGTVTVSVASSDTGAVTVSPAELRFTADDWDRRQKVSVRSVDDDIDNPDDARVAWIIHTASGRDGSATLTITVRDDD